MSPFLYKGPDGTEIPCTIRSVEENDIKWLQDERKKLGVTEEMPGHLLVELSGTEEEVMATLGQIVIREDPNGSQIQSRATEQPV